MHPKKSLFCSIFSLFLAFLLWPSSSNTESLSDKIKRFVQGEADTILALPAQGQTLIRHSGNYFLFIQSINTAKNFNNQGHKLVLFETSKGLLWEKTGVFERWSDISSSENVPPKVATGYLLDEETGVTQIFDTKGTKLAEIRGPTFSSSLTKRGIFLYCAKPNGWRVVAGL